MFEEPKARFAAGLYRYLKHKKISILKFLLCQEMKQTSVHIHKNNTFFDFEIQARDSTKHSEYSRKKFNLLREEPKQKPYIVSISTKHIESAQAQSKTIGNFDFGY